MSSRFTRSLLKLYPRRIRDRYGDELLDLQDELRAHGDVSRACLIRDMLAGALLAPRTRRAYLMIGALLIISGLAVGGVALGGPGVESPARAFHRQATVASTTSQPRVRRRVPTISVPFPQVGSCFVGGSSCSQVPCTQFTGQPSTNAAVASSRVTARRIRPHRTTTRCTAYPHVGPERRVFIGG